MQKARVNELIEHGADIRTYNPGMGKYSSMHAKTWLCDGQVYMGGSCNFTNNSLSNNAENLLIVTDPDFIADYVCWFEDLWRGSAELSCGQV